MIRIVSSDILIADVIVPVAGNPALNRLVEKYALKKGGKVAIDKKQFDEFSAAIEGVPAITLPGGSSANVLTTLSKIMKDEVSIRFIGVAGEGPEGDKVRVSLSEASIALLPERLAEKPVTAVSYVIMFPDGQRTIATYPGNARDLLKPEMITETLIQECNAVLIQGSLRMKMSEAYADRLFSLSRHYGKEIWLALPTYSMPSGAHVEQFQEAINSADIILGNEEELARIYHATPETALVQLQQAFSSAQQVGFITSGDRGAALVTAERIQKILPPEIPAGAVVNTLGAGDTAFAGFLAGHLKAMSHLDSAKIAMALAAEKLQINGPRLPDPHTAIQKIFNRLFTR